MTRAGDTPGNNIPFLPRKDHMVQGAARKGCQLSMLKSRLHLRVCGRGPCQRGLPERPDFTDKGILYRKVGGERVFPAEESERDRDVRGGGTSKGSK